MTEEERVAELGKPRLGEITSLTVHIGESPEFKVHSSLKISLSRKPLKGADA